MSIPVRLDDGLVSAAAAEATLQHRTMPKQIEYWAELGRKLAPRVTAEDALALTQGLAELTITPVKVPPITTATLLERLGEDRAAGRLAGRVTTARVAYQQHPRHRGYLEALYPDGRRVTGRFSGGEFIPQEPHDP